MVGPGLLSLAQELAPPRRGQDKLDHQGATLKLVRRTRDIQRTLVAAHDGDEEPLATRQNSNSVKEGNQVKLSTENEMAGKIHEVKCEVEEKAGQLGNNPDLETEGQKEKLRGIVQKKIEQAEKVLGK